MTTHRAEEVSRNFDYFQSVVNDIVAAHRGEFALLREAGIIDYFPSASAAMVAGHKKFADGLFSVQIVETKTLDLGFLSHASLDRATV